MTPGERIAAQRRQKGMTQEMLSEVSGISLRTIQRLESNQSVPRAFTLKALADRLDIHIDELTGMSKYPATPAPDALQINIMSVIQRMNASGLTILLAPLLPLFITWILWLKNNKNQVINSIGKRIISFQLIWLVLTAFVLTAIQIIHYYFTGAHMIGHVSPLLPAYLVMLALKIILVITSSFRLQKQDLGVYRFMPQLF